MSAHKTPDAADRLKGSVKEAIGKLIGDGQVEAEGKAQRDPSPQPIPRSGVNPKRNVKT